MANCYYIACKTHKQKTWVGKNRYLSRNERVLDDLHGFLNEHEECDLIYCSEYWFDGSDERMDYKIWDRPEGNDETAT